MDRETFIQKSKDLHGKDTYDYSLLTKEHYYKKDRIPLICHKLDETGEEHGLFYVYYGNHLNKKKIHKCPKCSKNYRLKQEDVVRLCSWRHNNKYDYSKLVFRRNDLPFIVICHEKDESGVEHGEFLTNFKRHYTRGYGCAKCGKRYNYSTEEWVRLAKVYVKEDYIDFSQVEYVNNKTPVKLVCHRKDGNGNEHGEFLIRPDALLWQNFRCPKCKLHFLEERVRLILHEKEIDNISQYHSDWLGHLSLDFYLPQYNIAIECQGGQHFRSIDFYGGEKNFKGQLERDSRKQKLCVEHGIKLIYVVDSYRDVDWNIEIYTRENTIELSEFDSMIEKETENKML